LGSHICRVEKTSVLVVEDDENVSFVIVAALRLAGFDSVAVSNGRDALRAVEQGPPPDLIVLDVMLPDLDGFETCKRLQVVHPKLPVVFLTARDGVGDRIRGLTLGGDDYLPKPFSVEELVARVRVILRRSGKLVETRSLRCADVHLDDDAHMVTRSGQAIDLSPTEYKLLRYLLTNVGRVLTRAQILDHVWSYDFEGESTVVETFVSSLRKKVDALGPRLIHTVRGVGYRMNEP
jgi:two-component system OmpR family response regulator